MSVCGCYKRTFSEATHCVFSGNLDDPSFRAVAIQRITGRTDKTISLQESGELKVKAKDGKEYVSLAFKDFFRRKMRTTGHPFKDQKTEIA